MVDEVGADAVRFMMLMRKNDAPLDFDLAKVIEQSKDNPVFYVQYAHARCESVRRQAKEAMPTLDLGPAALARADLELLADPSERSILKLIAQYPRVVEQAARRGSRTAPPSTSMIWRANFMPIGTRARTFPTYALLIKIRQV